MRHFVRLLLLLSLTAPLFAVDPQPWMRHPEEDAPHEKKWGTLMTFYWTFDPDNADAGWDEWSKWEGPQDPVHLKGTDITVPRNMAEKYNLEGSGWYTENGEHRVINIIEPHAEPDSTLFKEVEYVDYGLDAPHYHYGLVPFRTVAAVHDDIPAGTWVYIPMFDGIEIPVYDLDDRTQIDYTFWHDGWFRVSDISWSFADDETQIDIFTGTVQATSYVYDMIWDKFEQKGIWNETKQEYQELDSYQDYVSFYYKADVPIYAASGTNTVYRYAQTIDTVHNDTRSQEFELITGFSEEREVIPADIDNDSFRDDLIIFFRESNTLKAYSNCFDQPVSPSTAPLWSISLAGNTVSDIVIGDISNNGHEGIIVLTDNGIYGNTTLLNVSSLQKLNNAAFRYGAIGDIDNNNQYEIILFDDNHFYKTGVRSDSLEPLTTLAVSVDGDVSAIALGDITAEGQDELFWSTAQGIVQFNFSENRTKLFSDNVHSVSDIAISYVDPDGYADMYIVDSSSVKVKYSSHRQGSPFVTLGTTTDSWISLASFNPRTSSHSPVANSPLEFKEKKRLEYSINERAIIISALNAIGPMSIYTMNGRKLASIPGTRVDDQFIFNLNTLNEPGFQPLIFSLEQNGIKVYERFIMK